MHTLKRPVHYCAYTLCLHLTTYLPGSGTGLYLELFVLFVRKKQDFKTHIRSIQTAWVCLTWTSHRRRYGLLGFDGLFGDRHPESYSMVAIVAIWSASLRVCPNSPTTIDPPSGVVRPVSLQKCVLVTPSLKFIDWNKSRRVGQAFNRIQLKNMVVMDFE